MEEWKWDFKCTVIHMVNTKIFFSMSNVGIHYRCCTQRWK